MQEKLKLQKYPPQYNSSTTEVYTWTNRIRKNFFFPTKGLWAKILRQYRLSKEKASKRPLGEEAETEIW